MQLLVSCLTIVLLGFVPNLYCVPISQPNDASQNAPIRNPEHNKGLEGGDMVPYPPSRTSHARGVAIRPAAYSRWPNGVVPYTFAQNISDTNRLFIEEQMRTIESLTMVNNTQCVRFRPMNDIDPYFITIFNGSGCYGPVGSWGDYVGVRPVSLLHGWYSTCMFSGIVQHELTHVLGFYHEQSRPDRDEYVSIQWSNIEPDNAFNFDKYNDTDVDTQMTPYDYGSVMHYDRNAFAINSDEPTIIPTMNSSAFIGQRIQLSPIDILEIQRYYGCVPTPSNPDTVAANAAISTGPDNLSTSSIATASTTTKAKIIIPSANTSVTIQTAAATSTAAASLLRLYFNMYFIYLLLSLYFANTIH